MNFKVARNHYGRFEHDQLKLYLNRDETFIVTPEIEKSKAFQTGVERGKFVVLKVDDLSVVEFAHGATDEMIEEARAFLGQEPEEPEPEPTPAPEEKVEEQPKEEEKVEETPPAEEKTEEKVEDKVADEAPKEEEKKPEGKPEYQPPFTEIAGNVDDALKAIAKETDVEKLQYALKEDERKGVQKALIARIKAIAEE